jgi:RNA polymerase sigma-70 factor, ECF subfamily
MVGDYTEAFAQLYEDNYSRIFNYILCSTGDLEVSLDLTSEVFLKALKAFPRFVYGKGSITAWLYRIASREIAMYFRSMTRDKKRMSRSFFQEVEEINRDVSPEEIDAAGRQIEIAENFIILSPLLRKLPEKYREVLFLRFFEDWPFDEIARLLGRPSGTVKAQCHRGLKMLKAWMQPQEDPEHLEEHKECGEEVRNLGV